MQTETSEAAATPAPGNGGGPAAGIDLDWLSEQDSLSPLSGVRPLRPLHGELSDLHRDVRRERQPAGPDLLDASGRRRPAGDGTGRPQAPRALPRLPGVRVGLSRPGVQYGKMIEPFKIALQKLGDRAREDQLAPAVDSPSLVSLSRPGASWRWHRPGCCSGSACSTGPSGSA